MGEKTNRQNTETQNILWENAVLDFWLQNTLKFSTLSSKEGVGIKFLEMSKTLCGHVELLANVSHWGNYVITTSDQLNHLRWKRKFWLISIFRFYEFININTQKINSTLKLHQSSWYIIKYSIFNICFRHQLILRGNNKTAASSLLLQHRLYNKINRYRPNHSSWLWRWTSSNPQKTLVPRAQ